MNLFRLQKKLPIKMNPIKIFITILFIWITYSSSMAQSSGLDQIDFFIGEWDIETTDIQADGSFAKGKAKSIVKYILDGTAMQDEFQVINQNGNIVFRGISIRSYNARNARFQIVWVMPGINGITDISAEWTGEKLVSTGKGYDGGGEFLERFEYYDITDNSYKFKMDRSYDGGKNWIENFSRLKATKVKG